MKPTSPQVTRVPPRNSSARILEILFVLLSACSANEEPGGPRGAIIYVIDTLRAQNLSAYGYSRDTSPNLDQLAAEGVRFDHCLSQSSWTKPSTGSILTGLYPSDHGADQMLRSIPDSVTTLAERLAAAGVLTAGFYANSWAAPKHGLHQGFGTYLQIDHGSEQSSQLVIDAALKFLDERGSAPFFCYLHVIDPHAPYAPSEPFRSKFLTPYTGEVRGNTPLVKDGRSMAKLSEADRRHLLDLYDGSIAQTDAQFGRLVRGLKARGLYCNTLIAVVADHGEEFYEHQGWQHNGNLFSEVVHVPLIIKFRNQATDPFPDSYAGLVQQIDLAPTILGNFGLPQPADLYGKELSSLVRTGADGSERIGLCEVDSSGVYRKAVIIGDLKYVRAWSPSSEEHLYDLSRDPKERNDLMPSSPDLASPHRAFLGNFMAQRTGGLNVLFQNGRGEPVEVEFQVRTRVAPAELRPFYTEEIKWKGELRDGRPEYQLLDEQEAVLYGARVTLHVEARDGDAVRIALDAMEEYVELTFLIDGQVADAKTIGLGSQSALASANPLRLKRAQFNSITGARLQAFDDALGEIISIRVWFTPTPARNQAVELTGNEIEAFQALGYMGDD